uniref:Uncharacterized protein n=1 Tax=Acrobeloides nanus TaxID=290746 RepID=A0A914C6N3_9BILA
MYNDSIQSPREFLSNTKLVIEFTILSDQQATRTLNITGDLVAKTEFFAFLNNEVSQDGIVYLTSTDKNKLARNITHTILTNDQITSDYIPSGEEENIINEMLGVISDQKVQSTEVLGDEWNSVFWNDIFTRPDIITEYANEIFTHDENTSHFKFDDKKENKYISDVKSNYAKNSNGGSGGSSGGFFGLFSRSSSGSSSGSETGSNSDYNETYDRYDVSKDELLHFINEKKFNVKWNGEKFEQKSMNLYRINTKALESRGQLLYRRVVLTELTSTQKQEIFRESDENDNQTIPIEHLPYCQPLSPYLAPIYRRCCHCGEGGDPARVNNVYTLQQNYPCADEGIAGHVISLKGYQTLNQVYKDIKPLISFMDRRNSDLLLAVDQTELDRYRSDINFVESETLGYCSPTAVECGAAVPLYEFVLTRNVEPPTTNHLYTTNVEERDRLFAGSYYRIICHLWDPNANTCCKRKK